MTDAGSVQEVVLSDVGFGGDAVGRGPDGKAVFVPFGLAGERVRVRVEAEHPRFSRATLVEVLEPSPRRCLAPCSHYGRCGGCVYQHVEYAVEVETKGRQLAELMRRVGGVGALPELAPVLPSPVVYGYRNKLRVEPLAIPDAEGGSRLAYGYCERDNKTLFELDSCPLAAAPLNDLLKRAPLTVQGCRNVSRKPRPAAMTLRLTCDGSTAFYFGQAPRRVPWLHERLLERPVSVPLGSFWQVNPAVADSLVRCVADWFAAQPTRTLVDAYSGAGTFSLAIGKAAQVRFLIESDAAALQAAEYNHAQWDGLQCRCRHSTTEAALPGLLAECNRRRTTVLLDPPRQGCTDAVVRTLCEFPVAQILYVSCNAATLARDVGRLLRQGGYTVVRAALFDMFPRTAHFETALALTRPG
jgi:23S rRNA (uracil1939-C5)-methyltransferase